LNYRWLAGWLGEFCRYQRLVAANPASETAMIWLTFFSINFTITKAQSGKKI